MLPHAQSLPCGHARGGAAARLAGRRCGA